MDLGAFVWYLQYYMFAIFDKVMLILGPILVCLACSLICLVTYTYFSYVLPLLVGLENVHGLYWWLLTVVGTFLLFNIVFNYINCVRTNPGTHKSKLYARLLREAKAAGSLNNASEEDEEEYEEAPHDASGPLLEKTGPSKRRGPPISADVLKQYLRNSGAAITNGSDTDGEGSMSQADAQFVAQAIRNKSKSWIDLGDNEWSVCKHSGKLKPPRAHYDHVTKNLVLNMDHYCPWMANVVGYGNYRFFFLFLLYMFLGAAFASGTAAMPFLNLQRERHGFLRPVRGTRSSLRGGPLSQQPLHSIADTTSRRRFLLADEETGKAARDKRFISASEAQELRMRQKAERERSDASYKLQREGQWYIMFTFILTLSVSIAVWLLLAWHIYLVFTAQTTIEFHGNRTKGSRLKSKGILYRNPYDLGWRKNWQQVFGPGHPLITILPSTRDPPWPPWPQHKWKDSTRPNNSAAAFRL